MGTDRSAADDVAVIEADAAAMLQAARQGPLDAPVAGCPGWDVARLCGHLGWVHRWATLVVRSGEEPDLEAIPKPPRPRDAAVEWFADGVDPLVVALRDAPPNATPWNRWGGERTVAFWARRQAIETAIHRWDVEAAVGEAAPIAAGLAPAGIDELFDVHLPFRGGAPFTGSLHLHAADAEGEWTLTGDGSGAVAVQRGHAKGDAAVRGPASALLLLLWRRIPPDTPEVEVFGDPDVLHAWLAAGIP